MDLLRGSPFEFNPYVAARAKRRKNLASDNNRFYCCHLVAKVYQRLGLLLSPPYKQSSNNYLPCDFAGLTKYHPLLDCQLFGPEIPISKQIIDFDLLPYKLFQEKEEILS